jgi:hypothetical protein
MEGFMLVIEEVRNGFVIRKQRPDEEEAEVDVVEVGEDHDSEAEAACKLARIVFEFYGLSGNRYSQHRPHVVVFPGDKYGNFPAECPLCYSKLEPMND